MPKERLIALAALCRAIEERSIRLEAMLDAHVVLCEDMEKEKEAIEKLMAELEELCKIKSDTT